MATVAASRRDSLATADGCGARAWAGMPTIRQREVPWAYSLPSPSSIRPSAVITVRNHCPNYVQRPSVGEDWPNEFH
jgi:hypothetical protein